MRMQKTTPALPVQNIKQSCEYYTNKLGFTIRHQEETFAIAVRDDIEIHLWQSCDKSWKWRSILLFLKPIWTGAETFIAGTASAELKYKVLKNSLKNIKSKYYITQIQKLKNSIGVIKNFRQ